VKIIKIKHCWECPHSKFSFVDNEVQCKKLCAKSKSIGSVDSIVNDIIPIPDWCPLESLEDEKK
jgi:hypothetical protein